MITETKTLSTRKDQSIRGKRLEWVDFAKGLAIILVVYRHSLVGLDRSGFNVPDSLFYLQEFVFNFRMPVFFMLSGIFLARSLAKKPVGTVLIQKIKTLLYPYLVWTVIFITLQIVLSKYTNSHRSVQDYKYIFLQPRRLDHMWYLLALFNTSLIMLGLSKIFIGRNILHLVFALGLYVLSFFISEYSFFSDAFYHYIFLVCGVIMSDHLFYADQISAKRLIWNLLLTTPIFLAGQLTWLRLRPGDLSLQFLFLIIILVACYYFYLLCKLLYRVKELNVFSYIGKHSIAVYILHFLIISSFRIFIQHILPSTPVVIVVLAGLVLGISIPIFIYNAGSRYGIRYLFSLPPLRKE